jgi:SAM-dependent methyltransferase
MNVRVPRPSVPSPTPATSQLNRAHYDATHDYVAGSPHLMHARLHRWLTDLILTTARQAPLEREGVLEIGAGHGGMTAELLGLGCGVTVTEVSGASVRALERRFADEPRVEPLLDPEGSLEPLRGRRFAVVLCCSVLHHIPDYRRFVETLVQEHLVPGGAFISIQDPTRYDTMRLLPHRADRAGYLMWRATRGDYRHGLAALARRVRGAYDESNARDMVEYHVLRNGVDEQQLLDDLTPAFANVELVPYWSNQLSAAQRLGDRLAWSNTFALLATDHRRGEP